MSEVASPPPVPTGPAAPAKKSGGKSCLLIGLIVLLLGVIAAGGVLWWLNRPIKPVVLSEPEMEVVEAKVEAIQSGKAPEEIRVDLDEPVYEKGSKEIVLTERELNGLLNKNTTLGDSLRFELATNAVHARLEMDLDEDLPVVGGKRLKAKARFFVKTGDGPPELSLDDVTVWGVSLPNEWLGNLKGKNFFGEILGTGEGGIPGVEEFVVERGRLRIRLKE